jgi:L-lactate dehydrogenase complex protein LldG
MPGETREKFMARVTEALGRDPRSPVPPPPTVDEALIRLAWPKDDLVAVFAMRAREVGLIVHEDDGRDLPARLLGVMGDLQGSRVAIAAGIAVELVGLEAALRDAGATLTVWKTQGGLDRMFDTDIGITDVHAALAETGTLICCADGGHNRAASLIPARHIAIVRHSDILPDMVDYYNRLAGIPGCDLPSSIAFITGPSKTADIEGILIKGVHGPGRVDVVLVDDAG